MPMWSALYFQDSNSFSMEQLIFFHDHTMAILVLITIFTLHIMISFTTSNSFNKYLMEGQEIESIWTVVPSIFLLFIAFPSLKTLYLMEETKTPFLTYKILGHQWYWEYEYTSFGTASAEGFMEPSSMYRLLKTSDLLMVPALTSNRLLISSADVIHSWALPSIGVKVDALPGRLNQSFASFNRLGLYSGQCSEICGMNHSFMPILVQSLSPNQFLSKINKS